MQNPRRIQRIKPIMRGYWPRLAYSPVAVSFRCYYVGLYSCIGLVWGTAEPTIYSFFPPRCALLNGHARDRPPLAAASTPSIISCTRRTVWYACALFMMGVQSVTQLVWRSLTRLVSLKCGCYAIASSNRKFV